MKTIKVIDLLNKIANGKIKDKTRFRINWDNIYRDFYYDDSEENQLQCLKNCSDDYPLYDDIKLNDEVEIIEDKPKEDKKIEKMEFCYEVADKMQNANNERFRDFINEIIDRLNGE